MTTAYLNVDGETCIEASIHVPNIGPWWAEVVFETAPDVADGAAVVLSAGTLRLSGTVDPSHNGVYVSQRRTRIIGGGGGWGKQVAPQHYHNDAGVKSVSVADDVARTVGESLGTFAPAEASLGVDYVRQAVLASRVLEDVIGGVPWWVGYDGTTSVGTRETLEPLADEYEVLDFNPRENLATLAVDDLSKVGIGSILTEGLESPLTVHEMTIDAQADALRVVAWGGGTSAGRGRLAGTLSDIIRHEVDRRLLGRYEYRVIQMSGVRVELQAVRRGAGIPDVLPVSMRPGIAGAHALLAGGSVVLVEFLEGNRARPVVTGFAGRLEGGHVTTELDLSVASTLRLGSSTAAESFLKGDMWATDYGTTFLTAMEVWIAAVSAAVGTIGPATATFETAIDALQAKLVPGTLLSTKVKGE